MRGVFTRICILMKNLVQNGWCFGCMIRVNLHGMLHLNVEKNSNLYLVKYTSMGQCIIILLNVMCEFTS